MKIANPKVDPTELAKHLDGANGVVIANRFEQCALWDSYHYRGDREWKEHGLGIMHTVGEVDDRPICVIITYAHIDGAKIVFIDPTSGLVDYPMIEKWMKETMPVTCFKDNDPRKRLNTADPTNFCNILPSRVKAAA